MKNQEKTTNTNGISSWVIVPVILIVLFGYGVFTLINSTKKSKINNEGQHSESDLNTSSESEHSEIKLITLSELIGLLGHDNDFIAQQFNDKRYIRSSSDYYYDRNKNYGDLYISIFENNNSISCKVTSKDTYIQLVAELSRLDFKELPKDKRLPDFTERKNYYKNDFVIVDYGYEGESHLYSLILKKIENIQEESLANEDGQYLYVGTEGANCYNSPHGWDKGETNFIAGTKVKIHQTDGEFIFCDYTTDAGLTISKWFLVVDLEKKAASTANKAELE